MSKESRKRASIETLILVDRLATDPSEGPGIYQELTAQTTGRVKNFIRNLDSDQVQQTYPIEGLDSDTLMGYFELLPESVDVTSDEDVLAMKMFDQVLGRGYEVAVGTEISDQDQAIVFQQVRNINCIASTIAGRWRSHQVTGQDTTVDRAQAAKLTRLLSGQYARLSSFNRFSLAALYGSTIMPIEYTNSPDPGLMSHGLAHDAASILRATLSISEELDDCFTKDKITDLWSHHIHRVLDLRSDGDVHTVYARSHDSGVVHRYVAKQITAHPHIASGMINACHALKTSPIQISGYGNISAEVETDVSSASTLERTVEAIRDPQYLTGCVVDALKESRSQLATVDQDGETVLPHEMRYSIGKSSVISMCTDQVLRRSTEPSRLAQLHDVSTGCDDKYYLAMTLSERDDVTMSRMDGAVVYDVPAHIPVPDTLSHLDTLLSLSAPIDPLDTRLIAANSRLPREIAQRAGRFNPRGDEIVLSDTGQFQGIFDRATVTYGDADGTIHIDVSMNNTNPLYSSVIPEEMRRDISRLSYDVGIQNGRFVILAGNRPDVAETQHLIEHMLLRLVLQFTAGEDAVPHSGNGGAKKSRHLRETGYMAWVGGERRRRGHDGHYERDANGNFVMEQARYSPYAEQNYGAEQAYKLLLATGVPVNFAHSLEAYNTWLMATEASKQGAHGPMYMTYVHSITDPDTRDQWRDRRIKVSPQPLFKLVDSD